MLKASPETGSFFIFVANFYHEYKICQQKNTATKGHFIEPSFIQSDPEHR